MPLDNSRMRPDGRRLALSALNFSVLDAGSKRRNNLLGDYILQVKDVFQRTIEFGPPKDVSLSGSQ